MIMEDGSGFTIGVDEWMQKLVHPSRRPLSSAGNSRKTGGRLRERIHSGRCPYVMRMGDEIGFTIGDDDKG